MIPYLSEHEPISKPDQFQLNSEEQLVLVEHLGLLFTCEAINDASSAAAMLANWYEKEYSIPDLISYLGSPYTANLLTNNLWDNRAYLDWSLVRGIDANVGFTQLDDFVHHKIAELIYYLRAGMM